MTASHDLGSWWHLAFRFFQMAFARRLSPTEQLSVAALLFSADESRLFYAQSDRDQRHGYDAAMYVASKFSERLELQRAALFHDAGKRHAALGVVGRSIASFSMKLRLPDSRRVKLYRDHGILVAAELRGMGVEPMVSDYAEHHHGQRPRSINEHDWLLLHASDGKAASRHPSAHTMDDS